MSSSAPSPLSLFELVLPLRTLYGTYLTINHSNVCVTLLLYLSRERWRFLVRMVVKAARTNCTACPEVFLEPQLSAAVRFERMLLVESSPPIPLLRITYPTLCIINSASLYTPCKAHTHRPLRVFFFKSSQCPRWTSSP